MAEIEVAGEAVTTIVPSEEYPILSGPNEKKLMFSLFRENGIPEELEFTLFAGGEDCKVKCWLSLAQRDDIRNMEADYICYYLAGEVFVEHSQFFTYERRLFAALYDPHRRKGRWFPVPRREECVALHLPSHAFIKGNIESANDERCPQCGGLMRCRRAVMMCPNCTTRIG